MEEQLCFEIKTILLAGHETSAAMLTWTLLELTRNPECLQKVVSFAQSVRSLTPVLQTLKRHCDSGPCIGCVLMLQCVNTCTYAGILLTQVSNKA